MYWHFSDIGRYTLLVFDRIEKWLLSLGLHVLLCKNQVVGVFLLVDFAFSDMLSWSIGIRKLCVVCISIHLDLWKFRADWISEIFLTFPSRIQLLPRFACCCQWNFWPRKSSTAWGFKPLIYFQSALYNIFSMFMARFWNFPDIQLMQRVWQAKETFMAACVCWVFPSTVGVLLVGAAVDLEKLLL